MVTIRTKRAGVSYELAKGKKKYGDPDMFRQEWLSGAKWNERRDKKFKEGKHAQRQKDLHKKHY